ncbi:MAG: hypothetical protein R3F01_11355 [Lysobacteraceae bacterium]
MEGVHRAVVLAGQPRTTESTKPFGQPFIMAPQVDAGNLATRAYSHRA